MGVTNADAFKMLFEGLYASELWSWSENEFLEWLNRDYAGSALPENLDRPVCQCCGKPIDHEEARILSLEEVKTYLADDDPDKNPLWVQWATSSVKGGWVLPHTVEDLMWRYESIYQAHWVLWTQKPNDEQKEAVLWRI